MDRVEHWRQRASLDSVEIEDDDILSDEEMGETGSVSSSLQSLQLLFALGCSVPGARTEEARGDGDQYTDNAEEWRQSYHSLAQLESARRTLNRQVRDPEFNQVVSRFSSGLRNGESLVDPARVRGFQPPAGVEGVFTPCLYDDIAYIRKGLSPDGRVSCQRIGNAYLDLGASISVVDRTSAQRMEADSEGTIVWHKRPRIRNARVVGGGVINVYGTISIEVVMKDMYTGEWYTARENMNVIDGDNTFIFGNTFHFPHQLQLSAADSEAMYTFADGSSVRTSISAYAPGAIAAVASTADPLAYTTASTLVPAMGFATVELIVPDAYSDQVVHVSRLPDCNAYMTKAGLWMPDASFKVGKGGKITAAVFNSTNKDRELPQTTAAGRFALDVEHRTCAPTDEQIMAIVDSLDIDGVDEQELAKRREEVKTFIVLERTRYFDSQRLGRCTAGEFHVDTPTIDSGSAPAPNVPSRPLSKEQMEAAREEWQKMVDQGILVPSSSPWGAPIVMVKKPGGKGWRMCLDFRAGNAVAVKQHYPLPRVQETLDKIGDCTCFASLDCLKAFWQIPASKATQPKTAINFPWGKWEMRVMPMGMQAASATFQRTMDVLLRDISFAVGYIDDILVFSQSWEDHLLHVALVLDRIGGAGLVFNPKKCSIGKPSTKFLGHVVSADGRRPDPSKLECVINAAFPATKKEMHHWVSLAGYYAPHLENFALDTAKLQDYIHSRPVKAPNGKMVHLPADDATRDAFTNLQKVLTKDLVLAHPDFDKPFTLTVDAAKKVGGCGALLEQLDKEGNLRAVSMWSVRWIESTANWAPVEHECYALRRSVERYYEYLTHAHFLIRSDSEPLVWLHSLRRPKGRMAEWILELQSLDFTVEHIAGRMNVGSDALSRLALEATSMEEARQGLAINERSAFEAAALSGHVTPNELVDSESRYSESVHLGLAADSVSQADYDMASVSVYDVALESVRAGESGWTLEHKLRLFAQAMGTPDPKEATGFALEAVLAQVAFPERYRIDEDCWEAHGASSSNFRTWRKRVRQFVSNAQTEEAVSALVELSQRAPNAPA